MCVSANPAFLHPLHAQCFRLRPLAQNNECTNNDITSMREASSLSLHRQVNTIGLPHSFKLSTPLARCHSCMHYFPQTHPYPGQPTRPQYLSIVRPLSSETSHPNHHDWRSYPTTNLTQHHRTTPLFPRQSCLRSPLRVNGALVPGPRANPIPSNLLPLLPLPSSPTQPALIWPGQACKSPRTDKNSCVKRRS